MCDHWLFVNNSFIPGVGDGLTIGLCCVSLDLLQIIHLFLVLVMV